MMFFKRKLKYYDSIDNLPVYNWFKIQESNDLTYLLINKRSISEKEEKKLKVVLSDITCQYIDTFGISDEYSKILELKRDIRKEEIELLLTKKRIHNTFINVLKSKLKALTGVSEKQNSNTIWVHVKKYMGGNLDMKNTSVKEFYTILDEYKKELKQADTK